MAFTSNELGRPVDKKVMMLVANKIANDWKKLGMSLGLEEPAITNIEKDQTREWDRCYEVLTLWKRKASKKATVEVLVTQLTSFSREDIADALVELCKKPAAVPELPDTDRGSQSNQESSSTDSSSPAMQSLKRSGSALQDSGNNAEMDSPKRARPSLTLPAEDKIAQPSHSIPLQVYREAVGYIHDVSDVYYKEKTQKYYFYFVVQTGKEKYVQVVCLDQTKHDEIKTMQEAGASAHLTTLKSPQELLFKLYYAEDQLKMGKKANISKLKVDFQSHPPERIFTDVSHVKQNCIDQLVNIKVNVVSVDPLPEGEERRHFRVADGKGTISFRIPKDKADMLALDETYDLIKVGCKTFNDRTYVTYVTNQTVVEVFTNKLSSVLKEDEVPLPTFCGEIVSVIVNKKTYCKNCKCARDPTGNNLLKCPKCGSKVLFKDEKQKIICILDIDEDNVQTTYTLFQHSLEKYFKSQFIEFSGLTDDFIETHLLNSGKLRFTKRESELTITKLEKM